MCISRQKNPVTVEIENEEIEKSCCCGLYTSKVKKHVAKINNNNNNNK